MTKDQLPARLRDIPGIVPFDASQQQTPIVVMLSEEAVRTFAAILPKKEEKGA